jgi:two-component system, NarL family, response regulator NreC
MGKRIVLADDHKVVRDGLRSLLESDGHLIVGEAGGGNEAVALVSTHNPDLVIMDFSMPDMNGMEATKRIRTKNRKVKILALSMHSDKRFVADMFSAGASGYLLKDCAYDELGKAIESVFLGQAYVSPLLHNELLSDYIRKLQGKHNFDDLNLTPKERQVLTGLAEGRTTKEIAAELAVSKKTVDTHRLHLMEKLGAQTIADLIKYAIRQGLSKL